MLKQPPKLQTEPTIKDVFTDESVSEVITEYVPMPTKKKVEEHKEKSVLHTQAVKEKLVEHESLPQEPVEEKEKPEEKKPQLDELTQVLDDLEQSDKKTEESKSSPEQTLSMFHQKKQRKSPKGILFLLVLLLLLIALGFGFYTLFNRAKTAEKNSISSNQSPAFTQPTTEQVSATPVPQATPDTNATSSAEVTPEVNKKDIRIRIENGTTVAGEAARWKAFLEKAGYTVVSLGNASKQNQTETMIQANTKGSAFVDQLITDLTEKAVASKSAEALEDNLKYDILITIGK